MLGQGLKPCLCSPCNRAELICNFYLYSVRLFWVLFGTGGMNGKKLKPVRGPEPKELPGSGWRLTRWRLLSNQMGECLSEVTRLLNCLKLPCQELKVTGQILRQVSLQQAFKGESQDFANCQHKHLLSYNAGKCLHMQIYAYVSNYQNSFQGQSKKNATKPYL